MLISDQYLLLIFNESKGHWHWKAVGYSKYCYYGTLLIDLFLKDRLMYNNGRLMLKDPSFTGDKYLDTVIKVFQQSKRRKDKKIGCWIREIAYHFGKFYEIFEQLESKEILRCEKVRPKKFLPSYFRFFLDQPDLKKDIVEKLNDILVLNVPPNLDDVILLKLIHISNLLKMYFPSIKKSITSHKIAMFVKKIEYQSSKGQNLIEIVNAIERFVINYNTPIIIV